MPDPRQIVERIRDLLRSESVGASPETAALAVEYAELCREANHRLRRCGDFLHDGLRGEAVALAQAHPPLLDWVPDLRFKEIADWERACGVMGLVQPPRVVFDVAKALEEAVERNEPLRELLTRHRYLALAHAPLADRLAVLRQLILADPDNPIWKRDAQELERARLTDLCTEAMSAIRAGDVVRIDKLLDEADNGIWQLSVPTEVKNQLARTSQTLHHATALDELRALAPRVRSAYAAQSYEQCREVFAEWGRVVKRSRVMVPPELRQEILPLARWIDEQDDRVERQRQFAAACKDLAAAIKAGAGVEDIKQLYVAAARFELPIPDDLSSAYHQRLDAARHEMQAEKRRQYAFTALLIGVIALALGALVVVMLYAGKH